MRQSFRAYAKINISLDIVGRRENGYHDLKSIMQSVSLFDNITVENGKDSISITSDCPYLVTDSRNIAFKAAELFFKTAEIDDGAHIHIEKNIPMGAGLGGGSTDGARVLRILNAMYENPLSEEQIEEIALMCGADVPFCLHGGTCLAEGLGEVLTPLASFPKCFILLAKPTLSVNTGAAFAEYDKNPAVHHPKTDEIIKNTEEGNLNEIAVRVFNVLEKTVGKTYKSLGIIKGTMLDSGALGTAMTGSGSAVFGIFGRRRDALEAKSKFEKMKTVSTYLTVPVERY